MGSARGSEPSPPSREGTGGEEMTPESCDADASLLLPQQLLWSPSHFLPLWEGSPDLTLLPLEGFIPEASGCLRLKAFPWCCSSARGLFHTWLLTGSSPEIPQCNYMLFQGIICLVSVLTPCHSERPEDPGWCLLYRELFLAPRMGRASCGTSGRRFPALCLPQCFQFYGRGSNSNNL